jgi:hypothetical protein
MLCSSAPCEYVDIDDLFPFWRMGQEDTLFLFAFKRMKFNNLTPFWRPSQDDTSVFWLLFENHLFLLVFLIF